MSLSLESASNVKQKCRAESRKPKVQLSLKALFSYIPQHLGDISLQFVPLEALTSSSTAGIVADVPAKLYGLFLQSPSGAANKAYVKLTDDETTASATVNEVVIGLNATKQEFLWWGDGKPFTSGIMARSDTAPAGSTGSVAADAPNGFCIVGGP